MSNYFISKDSKTGEIVYLEYDKNGYKVKPKAKKKDAIEVNKIVFVSPDLTEKLLKKKINHKVSKLLLELNTFYDDDSDDGSRLRNMLKEAERLKLNIINNYKRYLGKDYASLTLKKIQIIIDGYRSQISYINDKKKQELMLEMFRNNIDMEEEKEKKGRGR